MNQKRTKPNKTRHNLRYERATWVDLNFLAKILERTYTDVMEEALNKGMAWIAKKSGLELPSQAKTRIRKRKLQEYLHPKKKAEPELENRHDQEPNKNDTPKEPEREITDEELEASINEMYRMIQSKQIGRELTMAEYLQGVKDGKWN